MTNVRFGSLADLLLDITSTAASGGKADVQTRQIIARKRLALPATRPRKSEADFLNAYPESGVGTGREIALGPQDAISRARIWMRLF